MIPFDERMKKNRFWQKTILIFTAAQFLFFPLLSLAADVFNPQFIISDAELQDHTSWTKSDIQSFLDSKGSYLHQYQTVDSSGTLKTASDIIYNVAQAYQINPKYILVTLQKEQSLITDDTPTQKQLDWAAGYGVCDSCSMNDPKIAKYKGFANQVENSAAIMRYYYNNSDKGYIKKKDSPVFIDNQQITPQSWATAFLYTYTPHLHGNENFWRIWNTWFDQNYPDGSLVQAPNSSDVWLLQNGKKRRFKNMATLITRADPKMIISIPAGELSNYDTGAEIAFPNYSLLRASNVTYLLDYDTLRPFASEEVVRKLGYNPQEITDVSDTDIVSYNRGKTIDATTYAPQGVIYQITNAGNAYYLIKDNTLYPLLDPKVVATNFKNLPIEKHLAQDLAQFSYGTAPITFADGALLKNEDSTAIYVMEKGKKRKIADETTFEALGYNTANIRAISPIAFLSIPTGEPIYVNSSLVSSQNKYLGDITSPVNNIFQSNLPSYLVAEYPSGRILAGKNIDKKLPMASLTKLLVAFEILKDDFSPAKMSTYSPKKFVSAGKTLDFKDTEKVKNIDILNTLLVSSENNVARFASSINQSSEAALITQISNRLNQWGADNTRVQEITGLSEKNISTPRDLLKIFTKVLEDKTIHQSLGRSSYTFNTTLGTKTLRHTAQNTNQLMRLNQNNYSIIASKTGFTDEAGAVLVMLVEAKNSKKQYTIITMGDQNYAHRFDEPDRLAQSIVATPLTLSQK